MRKTRTYLATLVLLAQTILPNFLYAVDDDSTPSSSSGTETASSSTGENPEETGENSEDSDIYIGKITQDELDDKVDEDVPDDEDAPADEVGEEEKTPDENSASLLPATPSEEDEPVSEKAESEGAKKQTAPTSVSALSAEMTITATCPSLGEIANELTGYLEKSEIQGLLNMVNNIQGLSTILDNFMIGNSLSDGDIATIDTTLTTLKNMDLGAIANMVESFSTALSGNLDCIIQALPTIAIPAIPNNISGIILALSTPGTGVIDAVKSMDVALTNLKALWTNSNTLELVPSAYVHQLSDMIPFISILIQGAGKLRYDIENPDGLLTKVRGIRMTFSTAILMNPPLGLKDKKDLINPIIAKLKDMESQLESVKSLFLKLDTLLSPEGLAGIPPRLEMIQTALGTVETFFLDLEAGNIEQALTTDANLVLAQIDLFRQTHLYQTFKPAFSGLAEAVINELASRGRINANGASQIKGVLTEIFTNDTYPLQDIFSPVVEQLIETLGNNSLAAPTAGLTCTASSQTIATGNETTLQLTAPTDASEARGYLAIVVNPEGETGLYLLPGELADLALPTPTTGDYTVELMTIGKDNILNPEKVWENVSGRGNAMPYTREEIITKIDNKVTTSSLSPERKNKISATLSLLESTIFQTITAKNLLAKFQTILKSRIGYIKEKQGQWIEVNEEGYLKASEALSFLEQLKTLAEKDDEPLANFIKALFNPTETYTIKNVSIPVVSDVAVSTYQGDTATIALSGSDADGATLIYVVEGTEYTTPSFTGIYNSTTTLAYVAYKTGDDCGTQVVSNTGTITITVSPRPASTGGSSGGGGGGSSLTADTCPNGDTSPSSYDGICSVASTGATEEEIILGGAIDENDTSATNILTAGTEKCSVENSSYSSEENAAYLYACEQDITTMRTVQTARMTDTLTRAELAKIISQYAIILIGKKPDTAKDCSAFSQSIAKYTNDLNEYMTLSCQLGLMGIHPDGSPLSDFMPDKFVSRAEFGTVFSRLLRGATNEGTDRFWYQNHLLALKNSDIITNIDPDIKEVRAWVFLQIYRSVINKV